MGNSNIEWFEVEGRHFPKSLFKFKSFSQWEHAIALFQGNIYFSSKKQLNDPFDLDVPVKLHLSTVDFIKKLKMEGDIKMYGRLRASEKEYEEDAIRLIEDPKFANNHWKEEYDKDVEEKYGVFALSRNINELFLWAHYADSHTGYAIEYDFEKLYPLVNASNSNKFLGNLPVEYTVKYPKLIPKLLSPDVSAIYSFTDWAFRSLSVKSKEWKYESEWRIFSIGKSKYSLQIGTEFIKAIYFGLNCDPTNIERASVLIHDKLPHCTLYKAMKRPNKFGIDFEAR